MTDNISPDPDPIRHSAPSGGGELPGPEVDPTPPEGAPEDPTPPDAPVIPEVDGGVIVTDVASDAPLNVAMDDLIDGEIDRGN